MQPLNKWTLRVWFFDVQWRNKGKWKLYFEHISRKRFIGKRRLKLFINK